MYLDHRTTIKIARILDMVDMSALLLDANGSVILPEGDARTFTLPEELKQNPTTPFVYGGVTLIGTSDEQPVFVCLQGSSEDIKKCAVLCAELINLLLKEDMSQTTREQALRAMLRGEVEGAELESMAVEHEIPLQSQRCVLYFYFQDMEVEAAIRLMDNVLSEGDDQMTEVGRHAVAMLKSVNGEEGLADGLDELLLVAGELGDGAVEGLGGGHALVLHGGEAACEDGLADEGQRHALVERLDAGPLAGALLSGGVEDLLDQR